MPNIDKNKLLKYNVWHGSKESRKEISVMSEEILLTQEGYDKIVAEHEELVSVRRKEVSERLKEAISYGDLSENSEYDSAKARWTATESA